jgi:hypothetical protein
MESVGGWLSEADGHLLIMISEFQRSTVRGDLFEIGAYEGRSAILLGYLAYGSDSFGVCDLFGNQAPELAAENERWYVGLDRARFEANYRRFHRNLPEIFQCRSSELESGSLGRRFRLVHIDGSHQYKNVKTDLALARAMLVDGGVVAIDDFRSAHTFGVAAAVWEEIVGAGLRPWCVGPEKLYGSWSGGAQGFHEFAEAELARVPSLRTSVEEVGAGPVMTVLPSDFGSVRSRGLLEVGRAYIRSRCGRGM